MEHSEKPLCLICKEIFAVPKEFNVHHYYEIKHKNKYGRPMS